MYPYKIKFDKNKLMAGMVRRAQRGDEAAMIDILHALSTDDNGEKPTIEEVEQAMEAMTWAEYEDFRDSLTELVTPKAR